MIHDLESHSQSSKSRSQWPLPNLPFPFWPPQYQLSDSQLQLQTPAELFHPAKERCILLRPWRPSLSRSLKSVAGASMTGMQPPASAAVTTVTEPTLSNIYSQALHSRLASVFSPTLWCENYYPIYFIYKITRHRKPGQWAHETWVHDSNLSTFYTEPAFTPALPNFYDLRTSTQWGFQRNSYWKLKLKRHELAFKIH